MGNIIGLLMTFGVIFGFFSLLKLFFGGEKYYWGVYFLYYIIFYVLIVFFVFMIFPRNMILLLLGVILISIFAALISLMYGFLRFKKENNFGEIKNEIFIDIIILFTTNILLLFFFATSMGNIG